MKQISLPPNSISLIESMRDIGYSIEAAVADIIDNSITANAKNINIRFSWNFGNPWFAIIDDGSGMDSDTLMTAMKLGTISPLETREKNDLGRFGLGLKTASFSQCRCLTVISKKNSNCLNIAQWNIDTISINDNNWLLNILSKEEISQEIFINDIVLDYLEKYNSGTAVIWQNIDRLIESSSNRESKFNEILFNIRTHLELVFHRYLSPGLGENGVDIFLNNSMLKAYDPFNTKKSTELREEKFKYDNKFITVQPYILPHHGSLSKPEWEKYAGKNGYIEEQGFYVYRNRRLIIYSTWFRLLPKKEITKLLRVRVDIPNSLDRLWRIDIKKANAFPPEGIRDELKRIIGKIELSGKKVITHPGTKLISKVKIPIWERVVKENQILYQINRNHPLLKNFVVKINEEDRVIYIKILEVLESTFPRDSFYGDMATDPQNVVNKELTEKQIETLLDMFLKSEKNNISKQKLREILQISPFDLHIDTIKKIYKSRGYEYEP